MPHTIGANGARKRAPKQIEDKYDVATGRFISSRATPQGQELSNQSQDRPLYAGGLHNKAEDWTRLHTNRGHLDTVGRDIQVEKVALLLIEDGMAKIWTVTNNTLINWMVKTQEERKSAIAKAGELVKDA